MVVSVEVNNKGQALIKITLSITETTIGLENK
jgi:hypothetical protein